MIARGLVVLLCGASLAGCGAVAVSSEPAPTPTVPLVEVAPHLPQISNGPVAFDPDTKPIAVKLSDLDDPVDIDFTRPPKSGLLFDLDTGEVLWRRDPTRVVPIASLTKMMTSILVSERLRDADRARITKEVLSFTGSGVGMLGKAKRVPIRTLLYGLMLPSGNDAAIALALASSGTQKDFVALMNRRAEAWGMSCTHYASPSGIVDEGNHSCAADLAAQARAVLDDARLARIVKTKRKSLPFPVAGGRLTLYNTNPLLREDYPGTLGIKTGFTNAAGHCLVAAAERGGRRLGVVLLDSDDTGGQARKLLDRGFDLVS